MGLGKFLKPVLVSQTIWRTRGNSILYTAGDCGCLNVAIAIKILQNYGIPGEEIQLAKFVSRLKMAGPIGDNWNERLEM